LTPVARRFTRPGWVRLIPWVTGMVLCWKEHTRTPILTALGLEARWRVLERLAAYAAWDHEDVERQTIRVLAQERPARWGRSRPVAIDDTTRHRTSKRVWGTWTFHDASARRPTRAETVPAHHWVVSGDLVPGRPWTYLPPAARLYSRHSPLPVGQRFRPKTALAGELLRQVDTEAVAPSLAVFGGAYAVDTVMKPCLEPCIGRRRIAIVTRVRADARLYHAVTAKPRAKGRART
jgi:hypothetical protein